MGFDDTTAAVLTIGIIVAGLLLLFLMTQRPFWIVALFFTGLAAAFTMLAYIVEFQILFAMGLFVIAAFCWRVLWVITRPWNQ